MDKKINPKKLLALDAETLARGLYNHEKKARDQHDQLHNYYFSDAIEESDQELAKNLINKTTAIFNAIGAIEEHKHFSDKVLAKMALGMLGPTAQRDIGHIATVADYKTGEISKTAQEIINRIERAKPEAEEEFKLQHHEDHKKAAAKARVHGGPNFKFATNLDEKLEEGKKEAAYKLIIKNCKKARKEMGLPARITKPPEPSI